MRSQSSDDAPAGVLTVAPGAVIAVHLSYASRAEQRGRRPENPSYFLKPTSSLAGTDGVVERPAGTELLAFEGEIALVIGTTARNVTAQDAWQYVAGVTAANDFGVYDLRAADKGSNVRSKGRDGFTPVGPAVLDASGLDPARLRITTRVNGLLAQDDTTDGLLFPLPQLVADLSQHLTLHPGDLILTGTPAGSSVVVPGDVVEVEVHDLVSGTSTGILRSTVTQGVSAFDPALGSTPQVDDTQRIEAWGSHEAAGLDPASDVSAPDAAAPDTALPDTAAPDTAEPAAAQPVLTAELRALLMSVPVAALSGQLRKRGLNDVTIDGVRPLHPDAKLVGTARTLRFVPGREDLFASHGGGYNAQKRAFDSVGAGEVIVVEARGETGSGTLGDILALRAQARGAAGIVTDGCVRDTDAVVAVGIPVWSAGAHPAVLGRKHVPWDVDVAIGCGGTTVLPGDVLVGDADGVIVIPPALVAEVAAAAAAQELEDAWIADRVREGNPVDGLFPMNAEWRVRFERRDAR